MFTPLLAPFVGPFSHREYSVLSPLRIYLDVVVVGWLVLRVNAGMRRLNLRPNAIPGRSMRLYVTIAISIVTYNHTKTVCHHDACWD